MASKGSPRSHFVNVSVCLWYYAFFTLSKRDLVLFLFKSKRLFIKVWNMKLFFVRKQQSLSRVQTSHGHFIFWQLPLTSIKVSKRKNVCYIIIFNFIKSYKVKLQAFTFNVYFNTFTLFIFQFKLLKWNDTNLKWAILYTCTVCEINSHWSLREY